MRRIASWVTAPLIAAAHDLQPSDHNFRAGAGEGPWIAESDGAEQDTTESGE
jgi:hypothetical protein